MQCHPTLLSILAVSAAVIVSPGRSGAQETPLSDPENTGKWVLNEDVSDEFDGDSLNLDKWRILGRNGNYYGEWKGRAPSQYSPENVEVANGYLTITSKWDPDFRFAQETFNNGFRYGQPAPITTGGIFTKSKFKHGYLEMRCKAADGPISSSFWTTGIGGEIDVFEHYGENPADPYAAKRFQSSFHDWRKGSQSFGKRVWTNNHQLDFRVADDFHVYGLHWSEDFVKVYVDGMLVHCVTKQEMGEDWVANREQKIWIDSETFNWEVNPSKLTASDFGNGREFVVDYCRVWQRKEGAGGCETRANLLSNPGFEQGMDAWDGTAELIVDGHTGRRAARLERSGEIEQTVTVKPATTYVLSGRAKSPKTNERDRWFNAYLGIRGHGKPEANARFFFPDFHEKSVQFTTGPQTTSAVVFFTNGPQGETAIVDDIKLVETSGDTNTASDQCKRRARRLLEKGVRVVQLFNGSDASGGNGITNWDSHRDIKETHAMQAEIMDQATAALIADLKQRGMLENTLVVWCTEFGRMPFLQANGTGRDHNPDAFTCFLAGAGVKPGFSYGESDSFGFKAAVNETIVYDFNATLLHLMGLDHKRLTYYHNGIERRLTNVHGRVLHDLLA